MMSDSALLSAPSVATEALQMSNDAMHDARPMLEAALALASEHEPERVLTRIVELARDLVGARWAALGVMADNGRDLARFIHVGLTDEQVEAIGSMPVGRGVLGALLARTDPLRLDRISDHVSSIGFPANHPPMERFIGVPLVLRGATVGSIYLTREAHEEPFTDAHVGTVVALAAQAVVAIERAALYERQRMTADRMEALSDAIRAVNQEQDPERVLRVITDAARRLVGAEYAALGVVGDDGRTFTHFIHSGMDPATVERVGTLPEGRGVLGAVVVEGRPMRLPNLGDHPASFGFPEHHPPMRSFLGVPIVTSEGDVVGNLYLTNRLDADEFGDEEEALILDLAGQAAIAIQTARSLARERGLVDRMRQLLAANLTVSQELRPDAVLQTFVDAARTIVGAEYAALGVIDETRSGLNAFIHSGMAPEVVEQIGDLPRGLGLLRSVIVSKRPMRIPDLGAHPASVGFPPNHPPMASFLGVPLRFKGAVFGNLYLTNKIDGGEFTDDDELVASAIAAQAAVAIENARSYQREQDLVGELQAVDEMRMTFVNTVTHELKSPLTILTGYAGMLDQLEIEPGGPAAAVLESIGRQANRLYEIVENLLDLSRIESGALDVRLSTVALGELVRRVLELTPAPDGTVVDVHVDDGLQMQADPAHVSVAIANYVVNAFRHGGPHVAISAQVVDGAVTVVVEDDGPGVPEESLETLFQPFSRSTHASGTGLGLALLRGRVRAMGGEAWYEPRTEGGSRFSFRLPAA